MYSLRQKINQLFISGYNGENAEKCRVLTDLLKNGLGGVIFFTKNIKTVGQFRDNIAKIKEMSLVPPFLSIDQEGGRVERTENIHGGKKYLSARDAAEKGIDFVKAQTAELCDELLDYGINMNFAPVLDTNTNPKNPIIGVRAYGDNPDDVIKFGTEVFKIHQQKGVIPVGKHFPGHGDTSSDSHLTMPKVALTEEQMAESHLKPFKFALENGLDALMAAHVYYTCYDKKPTPASLSENVLRHLLREKLGFDGLILSDDMVMGAVLMKDISKIYAQGIMAGINVFLYRNSDERLLKILDCLEENAKKNEELLNKIEQSFEKVIEFKRKYRLI